MVLEEYRQTDSTRVRTTRWPNRQQSQLRSLMVRTTRAGVWKLKYSWSRSRFSALSMVQRKYQKSRQSSNHGRNSTESRGRPFSSRWSGHCSSSMAFRKMRRRCGIIWRRTTSRRWSWTCGLCEMRCQLWDWAIARMYRRTHRRFRVMGMTSIFAPIPIAQVLVVVQCQRASTPITWWRVYRRMMIGGFSPSWCTTRLTPWPTNRRRLLWRWKPTKHDYRRTTIRRWQPCFQTCGQRARNGNRSRLGSPRSPVVVAAKVMVVVRRVRSIAAGILRSATGAIRWGTLHGIVQALHRWRA